MTSCSFTWGVSLISSATFSRCTCGNRPPRPSPSGLAPPAAADQAGIAEPEQALGLDPVPGGAEVALLVERHLQDHRLHEDLLAGRIEQLDHPAQRLVVLERRNDDQGVGGAIEVEAHLPL